MVHCYWIWQYVNGHLGSIWVFQKYWKCIDLYMAPADIGDTLEPIICYCFNILIFSLRESSSDCINSSLNFKLMFICLQVIWTNRNWCHLQARDLAATNVNGNLNSRRWMVLHQSIFPFTYLCNILTIALKESIAWVPFLSRLLHLMEF